MPEEFLDGMELIDTGRPNETTMELVAWVKSRADLLKDPLETIGNCAERILAGEPLKAVMRDHHRAQVLLGVVPQMAQTVIAGIEQKEVPQKCWALALVRAEEEWFSRYRKREYDTAHVEYVCHYCRLGPKHRFH